MSKPVTFLMAHVEDLVEKYGSTREAAQALGVNHTYLCRLESGFKNNPSDEILRRLGLVRVVTYRKLAGKI